MVADDQGRQRQGGLAATRAGRGSVARMSEAITGIFKISRISHALMRATLL
jgi:hypothetical protein